MPTMKEQIESARAYIKAEQWSDARRILRGVDHPKAKEWLKEIDEKDSPPNINTPSKLFLAWGQMTLAALLAGFIAWIIDGFGIIVFFVRTRHEVENVLLFIWIISFAGFFYLLMVYTRRLKDRYFKPKPKQ